MMSGIIVDAAKSVVRIVLIVLVASIILQALGVSPLVVVDGQTSDSVDDSDEMVEYTEDSWDELGIHSSHIRNGNFELPTTNRTNTVEFQSEELSNNTDEYTVFIDFNQEWPNNTQVDSYVVDDNLHTSADASVSKTEREDLDRYVFSDSAYFDDGAHESVEFRFSINYSVHSNIDSISIYEGDVSMSEYENSRDNTEESSTEDSTDESDKKADSEEPSTTPTPSGPVEDDVTEGLAAVLDSIFYPNTTSVSNVVIINHIFSLLLS